MDGVCVLAFFLWQGGDSGKLSLQVLCNANGSCRLVLPGVLVVVCFFFFLFPKTNQGTLIEG